MIPTAIIDTLELCFRSLSELGASLTPDEWDRPTELPNWSVKDNLSHLVAIERMLEGLPGTSHRAEHLEHVKNPIGENNEHEVDSRRPLPGSAVLAEWNEITARRLASLRAGTDEYFATPMITPTGPGTLADFLSIRVLDCWVHELDMRRAVGKPGHLSGPAAEHTIDRLLRTVPIVVGKRAATPEGQSVVIDIDSPGVHRHVVCEVRDGRASFVDTPSSEPRCSITLGCEEFVMLATGRVGAAGAHATITGDAEHAGRVLDQFNMMI